MGMYNEVHASCPQCGEQCTVQIYQIVLGFGNFNLDDLSTFNEHSDDVVRKVREAVLEENFYCDECPGAFNPLWSNHNREEEHIRAILFGEEE